MKSKPASILWACTLLLAAGCGSSESPPLDGVEPFASALIEARAAHASDAQIQALEDAALSGDMSFETVSVLVEDTFACLEDAGIPYRREEPWVLAPGIIAPAYGTGFPAGMSEDQAEAIVDQCGTHNSYLAEAAFQTQSSVQEARDVDFNARLPVITQCLAEHGVQLPDNHSPDDVHQAVQDLLRSTFDSGEAVYCG